MQRLQQTNIQSKGKNKMEKMRFQITIDHNTLSDYDKKAVKYALGSKSPKDAIRRADELLSQDKSGKINLTYYSRQFLNGLAISAEADLYV